MPDDLAKRIATFLDAHHVMSLATVGPGSAHACNLFYARDGLALAWVSDPETRHSQNLVSAPLAAATVAPDTSEFSAIQGLQIAGVARQVVASSECQRLLALLEARYAFLRQSASASQKLRQAYTRTAVYRLQPSRIVWIDNSQGFGHKEVLDLPDSA